MRADRRKSIQLLQEAIDRGYYQSLVEQLQKDFDRANVPATFSTTWSPEMLITALHEKIYLLLMEHFPEYLNVLYMVDMPEDAFKNLPLTDAVEVAAEMSYLILEREWQKILLKLYYS